MTRLHEYEVDQQVLVRGIKFNPDDPKWWLYTVVEVTDTTVKGRNPAGTEVEVDLSEPDDYQSIRPVNMVEIAMPPDPGQANPDGHTVEIRNAKGVLHSRYVHRFVEGWVQVAGPEWEVEFEEGHVTDWWMIVFLTMAEPGNWLAERKPLPRREKMRQAQHG